MDRETKLWIRNAADELAAKAGCRFDRERGEFVVSWIQKYCRLYEGEFAGEALTLRDWQLDVTMRMFGWVRWSDRWQREVRRFRQASIFIAKKNKKSPTLAAWGWYLLAGDGEMGQKVFLAAKDGKQAREIAGKHAVEMLRQSPDLLSECVLNKATMQITHEPTRSIMLPLSSSNARTKESKEGLNGSVLVDETHVVDGDFMRRINRMGISRSEPLQIEVSTAGNNPDSYGKMRFDYARDVEAGRVIDEELLTAIYAVPQDVTDDQLAADPVQYGKMANPAFGHTVDEGEFLRDYERSKRKPSDLADFKMYRLNVWQRTSNPWLRWDDWQACRADFAGVDLSGLPCWMGLDLSKTRDMSSLVLVFRDDEEFYQLPFFWMPENEAKRQNDKASFLDWHEAGDLLYCAEDTIDQRDIYRKAEELAGQFDIQAVLFDRKYAEELTRDMEEKLGIERIEFPQTVMHFAGPTADYERLVISHKLHHNGNRVLAWQAGHVHVKSDANNNKRPVKPPSEDVKKIDGIVAGIMALSGAIAGDSMPAWNPADGILL